MAHLTPIPGSSTRDPSSYPVIGTTPSSPDNLRKSDPIYLQEQQSVLSQVPPTCASTADKIETVYPKLTPSPLGQFAFQTSELTPLTPSSASSLQSSAFQTTLKKVESEFSDSTTHFPLPSAPSSDGIPEQSLAETVQTVTVYTPSKRINIDAPTPKPDKPPEFSINSVLKSLDMGILPDIPQSSDQIVVAQTAVDFALFYVDVQQYFEECLSLKISFEKLKSKYNDQRLSHSDPTYKSIEGTAGTFYNKQLEDKLFYDIYAQKFMDLFSNSDAPCIRFRAKLVNAHALLDVECRKTFGEITVDTAIKEHIRFPHEGEINLLSAVEMIKILEKESSVQTLLLKLKKYLLTLHGKRLDLARIQLKFRECLSDPVPKPTVAQFRALEAQIRALKHEKQSYANTYIKEIFPHYALDDVRNKKCKAYLNRINTALASLEKDVSDFSLTAQGDLARAEACCIIL